MVLRWGEGSGVGAAARVECNEGGRGEEIEACMMSQKNKKS
jgi:hypothetical protein